MEEKSSPQTGGLTDGGYVVVPEPCRAWAVTQLSAAVGGLDRASSVLLLHLIKILPLPWPTAWDQPRRPRCESLSSKSPLPGGCCHLPKDTFPEVSVLNSWKASKPLCENWNEKLAGTCFRGGTRWLLCLQIDGIAAAGMTSLCVL